MLPRSTSPSTRLITSVGAQLAQAQRVLLDPDSFMTTLLLLVRDKFPEMLGWEEDEDGEKVWHEPWTQDTVWLAVREAFNVELPVSALDKIMAGVVVATSDFFFQHPPTFIRLCNIIGGDDTLETGVFDPADCLEMAWAMTEVLFFEPPEEPEPFCDEIRRYIGARLVEEGILNPPDVLGIAIRSKQSSLDPLAEFSDDPEMYQALFEQQNLRAEEITSAIESNMVLLLRQLHQLPLQNGSTEKLLSRIQQALGAKKSPARQKE